MSILVSKYGLSFMIHKESLNNFFEYPVSYNNPILILDKIKEIVAERSVLNTQFDLIELIYHNQLNALIPQKFFKPEMAHKWLSQQIKLLTNDPIAYDFIDKLEAYNVFVPFQNLEKYFSNQTNNLVIKHSATAFFNNINQVKNQLQDLPVFEIFLNVFPKDFQIAVFKNEKLLAYNHFEYEDIDEFLYFLFFMTETLEAKPHKSQIYIFGTNNKTELTENLSFFTNNIQFIPEKNTSQIFNYF